MISGTTNRGLRFWTINYDNLVVLQLAHVLPHHVVLARGFDQAFGGGCFSRLGFSVCAVIVDDHFQTFAEFFQSRNDARFVQIVKDGSHLSFLIRDCFIQHSENRAACFESHPLQCLFGFFETGDEVQAAICFGRQECWDRVGAITINKSLRGYETAGEGDVELARVRVAAQLDGCSLRFAITQLVLGIHEDRRDPVYKLSREFGVAREVDPAKLLNGRKPARQFVGIDVAVVGGEAEAVL